MIRDEETSKVLGTCKGRELVPSRDEAIIRLHGNTGARRSEVGNPMLDDTNLTGDSVHYRSKGGKDRRLSFSPRTARSVSRYLRGRANVWTLALRAGVAVEALALPVGAGAVGPWPGSPAPWRVALRRWGYT